MKTLTTITAISITFCAAAAALAKPMPAASLDEAARSPYVVLASYQGHEQLEGRSDEDIYMSGFTATYRLESVLKQAPNGTTKDAAPAFESGKNFTVRYVVHDLTPCMVDKSFRFSDSLTPSKKSKWILFLATNNESCWQTYRGSEGRLVASESNIKAVKALLSVAPVSRAKE